MTAEQVMTNDTPMGMDLESKTGFPFCTTVTTAEEMSKGSSSIGMNQLAPMANSLSHLAFAVHL